MGQAVLGRRSKERQDIPVFYLTQLIGLAMGLSYKEVGLEVHRIKAKKLLEEVKIA
jgi:heterodisulfide reductase subunit B